MGAAGEPAGVCSSLFAWPYVHEYSACSPGVGSEQSCTSKQTCQAGPTCWRVITVDLCVVVRFGLQLGLSSVTCGTPELERLRED